MKPFLYEGIYACYPMITIIEKDRSLKNKRLQEIVLFDCAEKTMGLGQVNFRKTSSFCEQGNFVNGINMKEISKRYTFQPTEDILFTDNETTVFDYTRWVEENKVIVERNITPGAHICCAGEWEFGSRGDMMYVGVAIAVPKDDKNAILFMECVGKTEDIFEAIVINDMLTSVKAIGENQGIHYHQIYVAEQCVKIKKDLGCAMVAIPYFLKA